MSNHSQGLVQTIEELAANAWPAEIQQQLEGWTLRATDNVTRRANSVLALGSIPANERWPEVIADFYHRRGLPIRFQISEAAQPGLDTILQAQGYSAEADTSVQTALCRVVLERASPLTGCQVIAYDALESDWLNAFLKIEGMSESKRHGYHKIMSAIGPASCFLLVRQRRGAVGVGLAVAERGWAGLFNIATAVEHRGKGIGTEIVRALAEWGQANDARQLYLQVMLTNQSAIRLYNKLGFSHLYSYHYRVKQDAAH